jgi:hypothetical protein
MLFKKIDLNYNPQRYRNPYGKSSTVRIYGIFLTKYRQDWENEIFLAPTCLPAGMLSQYPIFSLLGRCDWAKK